MSNAKRNEWARNKRMDSKQKQLLSKGKCPVCEIFLTSKYHTDCPFIHMHGKLD